MDVSLIVIAVFFGLGGSLILGGALVRYAERKIKGEGRATLDGFFRDASKRGLNHAQGCDELILREALARLRRVASDAVLACPSDWLTILDHEKSEAVKRLMYRRDLARRLGDTVGSLPYNHILYAEACRAVEEVEHFPDETRMTEDLLASVKTVRPN